MSEKNWLGYEMGNIFKHPNIIILTSFGGDGSFSSSSSSSSLEDPDCVKTVEGSSEVVEVVVGFFFFFFFLVGGDDGTEVSDVIESSLFLFCFEEEMVDVVDIFPSVISPPSLLFLSYSSLLRSFSS